MRFLIILCSCIVSTMAMANEKAFEFSVVHQFVAISYDNKTMEKGTSYEGINLTENQLTKKCTTPQFEIDPNTLARISKKVKWTAYLSSWSSFSTEFSYTVERKSAYKYVIRVEMNNKPDGAVIVSKYTIDSRYPFLKAFLGEQSIQQKNGRIFAVTPILTISSCN